MFKMSAFSFDTGRQTTPPLVDGEVYNSTQLRFMNHGENVGFNFSR